MANLQIIKKLAQNKNIPLEQLSRELGITPQAMSKIMRENSTKIDTLERIAHILEVSPSVFFETKSESKGDDKKVGLSESPVTGVGNVVAPNNQISTGDNSPNVNGDNNHVGGCATIDSILEEAASQRALTEKALGLLEKRDAQIDEMLAMMKTLINKN